MWLSSCPSTVRRDYPLPVELSSTRHLHFLLLNYPLKGGGVHTPSHRSRAPASQAQLRGLGEDAKGPRLPRDRHWGVGGRKGALEGEGTEGEEMSLSENEAGNGNLEWAGLLCPYQPCGLGQLSGPTKMVTTRLRRVVT